MKRPSAWPTAFVCIRRIKSILHGLTEAARQAAQQGNVILVGRGARQLLGEMPEAFHLRLVAPRDWRAERMARLEGWSLDQARAECLEVDRTRELFTRYFFGDAALQPAQYDLVVNTGRVPLDDVAAVISAFARLGPAEASDNAAGRRVLTLSRELGAGETQFAAALAERLGMRVYDRELMEEEAARLGHSRGRDGEDRRTARRHFPAVSPWQHLSAIHRGD